MNFVIIYYKILSELLETILQNNNYITKIINHKITKYIFCLFLFLVFTFCLFLSLKEVSLKNKIYSADAQNYIGYAYNLYKNKIFSELKDPQDKYSIKSSMYREPLYPLVLALSFSTINPQIKIFDQQTFFKNLEDKPPTLVNVFKPSIYLNIVMFLLSIVIMVVIANFYLNNLFISSLTPFVLFAYPRFLHNIISLNSETLTLLLFLLNTLLIIRVYKYYKLSDIFLSGILLGLLTLTKAHFLYFALPLCIYYTFILKKFDKKNLLKKLSLFILTFVLVLLPWLYRNYTKFNKVAICQRAGDVLLIRSEHNKMSKCEYFKLLYLDNLNFCKSATYEKLDRENPAGYYKTAKNKILNYNKLDKKNYENLSAKEAIDHITKNPFKHLITSIPLIIQGNIYVYNSFQFYISYFVFISFIIIVFKSFKNTELFPVIFISLYNFLFISLITLSIQRYHFMTIPIMIICAFYLISSIIKFIKKRLYENLSKENL